VEQTNVTSSPLPPAGKTRRPGWLAVAAVAACLLALAAFFLLRSRQVRQAAAGEVRTNPIDGQRYVWITPGTFQMGCSPGDNHCLGNEKPAHTVIITRGFWMGQTEVTVGAYQRFAQATGTSMRAPFGFQDQNQPVQVVTWAEARTFCQWAGGRLPTEAEWEYAARAGTTGPYYGELNAIAWYALNSRMLPHGVGEKAPNAYGLYDMLGSVWEWVTDWYDERYYTAPESRDPQGPVGGDSRVLRGGSWLYGASFARASTRFKLQPASSYSDFGFRCVREVIP